MLVIHVVRLLRRIPLLVVLGLLLMATGAVVDVVVHLGPAHDHGHGGGLDEHGAHLIGIAGMVLVLAGVIIYGARRQLRQRAARSHGGFDRNAHR